MILYHIIVGKYVISIISVRRVIGKTLSTGVRRFKEAEKRIATMEKNIFR